MPNGGISDRPGLTQEPPGIAVFFIAAEAVEANLESTLVELLEDQGHEALLVADLTPAQMAAASEAGNVEAPATAVVAIDLLPMKGEENDCPGQASFDNPKIAKALERAHYLGQSLQLRAPQSGPMTATRNSQAAWLAVRRLFPEKETDLRSKAERMRLDFTTAGAIRDLTREGRRARVELIEAGAELAIRKTYRAAALRYMEREIEVLQRLGATRPELPTLLDRGRNYIVISYIAHSEDLDLEHSGGRPAPLPLGVVRALARFIKACVREGFDPVDLRAPGNAVMTPEGLKVIDFELWRRCPPGSQPEDALCLAGVPAQDIERPRGVPAFGKPYDLAWYPLTLLSLESFLYDPPWLQQLKRGANYLGLWGARALRALARRTGSPLRRMPSSDRAVGRVRQPVSTIGARLPPTPGTSA